MQQDFLALTITSAGFRGELASAGELIGLFQNGFEDDKDNRM